MFKTDLEAFVGTGSRYPKDSITLKLQEYRLQDLLQYDFDDT